MSSVLGESQATTGKAAELTLDIEAFLKA